MSSLFGSILFLALLLNCVSGLTQYDLESNARELDDEPVYGQFSDDFLWATATAAYQIEGAWNYSFKSPSIWDTNSHSVPCATDHCDTGDVACDSFHLWRTDIQNMLDLGVNAYRFSISWTRIFYDGTPGKVDYNGYLYYNQLIDALLAAKITPMVTIFHWDLPQYIQETGGWLNPDIQDMFYYYADFLFYAFGDRVKYWITLNEPVSFAVKGYLGTFAPAIPVCVECPYIANKNLLMAHANAYHAYDKSYRTKQKGQVGMVNVINDCRPKTNDTADILAADRCFAWTAGLIFDSLEPLLGSGNWPQIMIDTIEQRAASINQSSWLPKLSIAEQQHIQGTMDFFGANIYTADLIEYVPNVPIGPNYALDNELLNTKDPSWPGSASEWLKLTPNAMTNGLNYVSSFNRDIPIYITECGWSNHPNDSLEDTGRQIFYTKYLRKALKAYQNGINLKGFAAWSLMDNFEWQSAYSQRFGLYQTNFSDPKRTRTPKDSAALYAKIIQDNGFLEPHIV